MEICLNGNDWQLLPLLPSEEDWRKVWEEQWEPSTGFPATSDWIAGTVPGDVIADAVQAGLAPDPWVDRNSLSCEWLSERNWVYRKKFQIPAQLEKKTIRLHFGGVDHSCTVYLNGEMLGTHEGMCLPFEFNVTEKIRFDSNNTLVVVVDSAPPASQVQGQIGRTSQARVWKARFAYDWDWCTRLVPVGIWHSVRLIATDSDWLEDVWVRSQVTDTIAQILTQVTLHSINSNGHTQKVAVRVLDPDGECVSEQIAEAAMADGKATLNLAFDVSEPRLWYPNEMGEQPLYQVIVELPDKDGNAGDTRTVTCGLRQVQIIPNENAAPDALPYTLEINGKKLFVKGWNWVPIDQLYGRVQPARYQRLIELVTHAHGNLLRVWGGGYLEREEFYDLCDRMGILVWQEFMQSSSGIDNDPPTDDEYLDYIENQARCMVRQRRNHPSLVIWCGGNELMERDWTPLTDQAPSLARLKSVVKQLDPDRIWLPTSASGPTEGANEALAGTGKLHDVHGPWQYQGPEEHYRYFEKIDPLFHSEFGTEGSANLPTLHRFVSDEYLFPPDANNPVWIHHGAWWLHRPKLEQMFGSLNTLEDFVKASQWMQAEGIRYIIESHRRRKWHCSGTCPWQFNESFPNTACTNSVDYLGLPKPAYWWIRRAYEPLHISLKYERLTWQVGQKWTADVWIHNSGRALGDCSWEAKIFSLDGTLCGSTFQQDTMDIAPSSAMHVGQIALDIAKEGAWVVFVTLRDANGKALSENEYLFTAAESKLKALLEAPQTQLTVKRRQGAVEIHNTGDCPALMVQLTPELGQIVLPPLSEDGSGSTGWTLPDEDYFCLQPGDKKVVAVRGTVPLQITCWNAAVVETTA